MIRGQSYRSLVSLIELRLLDAKLNPVPVSLGYTIPSPQTNWLLDLAVNFLLLNPMDIYDWDLISDLKWMDNESPNGIMESFQFFKWLKLKLRLKHDIGLRELWNSLIWCQFDDIQSV